MVKVSNFLKLLSGSTCGYLVLKIPYSALCHSVAMPNTETTAVRKGQCLMSRAIKKMMVSCRGFGELLIFPSAVIPSELQQVRAIPGVERDKGYVVMTGDCQVMGELQSCACSRL